MSTKDPPSPIGSALFGKSRRRVLALLFGHSDRAFFLREIARWCGVGVGPVQRELANLARAGIISRRQDGRQVYFQADPSCPVFAELRSLVVKTVAVGDVLRAALEPLRDRIRVAAVYGSAARGELRSGSDVDVLVLGDASMSDLVEALAPAQDKLGREVNPAVFPVEEWRELLAARQHFPKRVAEAPKIFLIGDERDLT